MELRFEPPLLGLFCRRNRFAHALSGVLELADVRIGYRQTRSLHRCKKRRPCRQVGGPRRGDHLDAIRALFGHGGHKTSQQHSDRLVEGCAFFVRQRDEFSEDSLRRRIVPAVDMRPDYGRQRVHQGEGVADLARIPERAFSVRERRLGKTEIP